jgi:hypothetical protein
MTSSSKEKLKFVCHDWSASAPRRRKTSCSHSAVRLTLDKGYDGTTQIFSCDAAFLIASFLDATRPAVPMPEPNKAS